MAIEARLIGRLGGSEVTSTPIDGQQTGQTWTTVWTVEVPAGETWLIALAATTSNSGGSSWPPRYRWRGTERAADSGLSRTLALVEEVTGPETVALELRAPRTNDTATITGTVYTAPLPD